MENAYGIVDIFSGPGGLGEGFSAFRDEDGDRPFSIKISVERDPRGKAAAQAAFQTLLLRSFLRKFDDNLPPEYHHFLNEAKEEPNWKQLYPEQWGAAEQEVHCLELGSEGTAVFLERRIANIHEKYGDRSILLGGPPCQAFSLAGRSRTAGIVSYLPHIDQRTFLYKQYVRVLRKLRPAAFVMENVKGMLSSAVKGQGLFRQIMDDLRSATGQDSYRLVALAPGTKGEVLWLDPQPHNFIVKAEEHQVPQARHRIIIAGLRQDIAETLSHEQMPRLKRFARQVSVNDVIGAMPRLRSGLSWEDDLEVWEVRVLEAAASLKQVNALNTSSKAASAFLDALDDCEKRLKTEPGLQRTSDKGTALPDGCPAALREWLMDENLRRLPNNDTRGHMASDLGRYLFAAAYGKSCARSPKASEFPSMLAPNHRNWKSGKFSDRFRVQVANRPASTITSHISKDGHYFIHPDPSQCRSLTVREAARLQTFPDNYYFKGSRTQQYIQVGNAVPPFLALQIAECLWDVLKAFEAYEESSQKMMASGVA